MIKILILYEKLTHPVKMEQNGTLEHHLMIKIQLLYEKFIHSAKNVIFFFQISACLKTKKKCYIPPKM